jgi:3-methyladenine DNA glycosylase Tag
MKDTPQSRSAHEALELVCDYNSFREFIWTLIDEREVAEEIERENEMEKMHVAPLGWQNSDISQFLGAGMTYFEKKADRGGNPTWRDIAEFLYYGKIYE